MPDILIEMKIWLKVSLFLPCALIPVSLWVHPSTYQILQGTLRLGFSVAG